MKIAIINQHRSDATGGSEIQCDFNAKGLVQRGHDVLYIAPTRHGRTEAGHTSYKITPVTRSPKSILKAALPFRPDAVYWRFNKHCFRVAAKGMHAAGIPIVFAVSHINDLLPWSAKPVASFKARVHRIITLIQNRVEHLGLRYVHSVTVNNEDLLPLSPNPRTHYIPNGMIDESVPFTWPRPFCAWIANIKPAKRPEAFVDLARSLEASGTDFLMVGKIQSKNYSWLENGHGLPSNLHYLGPKTLEEVNGILAASQLHIHTCQPEGFSNVFIQAWLQGKPSVSLGVDPCGYIKRQGLGVDAMDDQDRLVVETRRLLQDDAERIKLGQKARQFARQTFSIESMVNRVEAVLLEAQRNN